MRQTEKTLLEQLRFNEFEISQRKQLFDFDNRDIKLLKSLRSVIEQRLDEIVEKFYELQTGNPEIALLIGDADTLYRLTLAQRKYIIDLFSGEYGVDYVNNRLRIGLVHKRIGVEPKLYLSAVHTLKHLLSEIIRQESDSAQHHAQIIHALEKLLMFDNTLVFDTYIRSLVSEIEIAKQKSDIYAKDLENKIEARTQQLEEMSRTDPLTGLLNIRHLDAIVTKVLGAAERRKEPVSFVYIDIDDFKLINDTQGHQKGDEVLKQVSRIISGFSRAEDCCFRYGGDEFCIILPNCTAQHAREIFSHRILSEIRKYSKDLKISIGLVQTGPEKI